MIKITMETIYENFISGIITWEEAIELLENNCDMDTEEASAIVDGWNS